MKPDLTVKKFYEALAEGKLLGRKCNDCGAIEFPPVYSCNACGGHNTELIEVSGEGVATTFCPARGATEVIKELAPYALGHVTLAEGPAVTGIIVGIIPDNIDEMFEKIPLPVKARIIQLEGQEYHRIIWEVA